MDACFWVHQLAHSALLVSHWIFRTNCSYCKSWNHQRLSQRLIFNNPTGLLQLYLGTRCSWLYTWKSHMSSSIRTMISSDWIQTRPGYSHLLSTFQDFFHQCIHSEGPIPNQLPQPWPKCGFDGLWFCVRALFLMLNAKHLNGWLCTFLGSLSLKGGATHLRL